MPLREALRDACAALDASGVPYMVIGGLAVGFLSEARSTRDVDICAALADEQLPQFLALAQRHGLAPAVKDAVEFAQRSRVLLLTHVQSRVLVEIALAGLPFETEALGHAQRMAVLGLRVPVPTVEDLLVMKGVAGRPLDLQDMARLLTVQTEVDVPYVRKRLREFAAALDNPALLTEFGRLLKATRTGGGGNRGNPHTRRSLTK